ncbi:MAG TPA: ABC transporter permease [Gammaproteobacteria bacterium]|nr:ABC transporter permease [Gammaproteobacteria bacterium]
MSEMPARDDRIYEVDRDRIDVVERPRSLWRSIWSMGWLRKSLVLVVLAAIWEIYGRRIDNELVLPTFLDTLASAFSAFASGELPAAAGYTIPILLIGYLAGLALAGALTALATATRIGADLLETLTAMFNPLPSIALLPLALLWFGLGEGAIIFVLIHAVLWAVALNTFSGFKSVSPTLRMVGQNYGLSHGAYILKILIPGAFPSILTGLKIGWAFAWRTLIAAELVFGAQGGSGGLGWFVFERKNQLLIADVFAGLLTVILFGLVVENVIFKTIERRTVERWGMSSR